MEWHVFAIANVVVWIAGIGVICGFVMIHKAMMAPLSADIDSGVLQAIAGFILVSASLIGPFALLFYSMPRPLPQ